MKIADLAVGLDLDQSGFQRSVGKALNQAPNQIDVKLEADSSGFVSGAKAAGKAGGKAAKVAFVAGIGSLAVAGAAAAAGFMKGVNQVIENETVGDTFAARTGLTPEQAAKYGKAASASYRGAWGEDLAAVSDAAQKALESGLLSPESSRKNIESTQQLLLDTAKILEEDVGAAANAAGQLVRTGMAKNAEEAFDIIVKGQQMGVNSSDDLLDTFKEYGTQFRQLGLDGGEALALLSQGLQGGARDADTVADALKEFAIRGQDMSDTSVEAYKALGLNAKKTSKAVAEGGDDSQKALGEVIEKMKDIKNPTKRAEIAVALFGTKAEDLQDALDSLDPTQLVEVDGAAEDASKTLNDNFATAFESVKRTAKGLFVDVIRKIAFPVLRRLKRIINNEKVQEAVRNLGDAFKDSFGGINTSIKDLKPAKVVNFLNNIAAAIPGIAEWFRDEFTPAFKDFVDVAKDVSVGVGSGAWGLINEIGNALMSLPAEWRDDIVKIAALLAVIAKLKPVGGIFKGIGNIFGKGGMFAGTKTMTVTAAAVYVNGKGGIPGGGGGGKGGGWLGKGGKVALGLGAAKVIAAAAIPVAVAAGVFIGIPALIQKFDPGAPERTRRNAGNAVDENLNVRVNVEKGKTDPDPLVRYIANNISGVGAAGYSLNDIFQNIIVEATTGQAESEIDSLTRERTAEIAALAQTGMAQGLLDETAAQRIAEMLAEGKVEQARELLDETVERRIALMTGQAEVGLADGELNETANPNGKGRDAPIHAVPRTEAFLSAMDYLTNVKNYSVDVALNIITKPNEGPTNDAPASLRGSGGLQGARSAIQDAIDTEKDKVVETAKKRAAAGSASPFNMGGELFPGSHNVYTFAGHNPSWAWDVGTPTGTPIYAPWAGLLSNADKGGTSYGKYINLSGNGRLLRVAHLSRHVTSGFVKKGQLIGYTGYSGGVRPYGPGGAHAHVETYVNGSAVNPRNVLRYDTGGILPHGGGAVNTSRKPEAILTNDQWTVLRNVAKGLTANKKTPNKALAGLRDTLKKVNQNLDKLKDSKVSIRDTYAGGSELALGVGNATSVGDVIGRQSDVLSRFRKFTNNLIKLKKMGFSMAIRRQIIDAGPVDGYAMSELLLKASGSEVSRLNSTQSLLAREGRFAGDELSGSLYGSESANKKRRQNIKTLLRKRQGKKARVAKGRAGLAELRSADINIGTINVKNEADVKRLIQRLNHLQRAKGKK